MTVTEPSTQSTMIKSIQAEQMPERGPAEYLTESEVDEYADSHSDEVVECRMGMRHDFPKPQRGVLATFVDRDENGLYIAKIDCQRCGLAVRVEKWEPVRRGRGLRWRRVSKNVQYRKGRNGETYNLPPGTGRMRPLMLQESVMSRAMQGVTLTEINKQIKGARSNG